MDQFGVLVESIGFKAHGKSSAPLADLKNTNKSNDGFPRDIGISSNNHSINVNDLDGIFRSNTSNNKNNPNSVFDDVFGGFDSGVNNGGIDLDSVFNVSNSNNYNDDYNDDVFGFNKTSTGSSSVDHYDVLGNKVWPVKKTSSNSNLIDDLLRNFGEMGVKSNSSGGKKANASSYDDLLRNFNGSGTNSNDLKKNSVKKQETTTESGDLLSGFGLKTSSSNGRKSGAIPSPPSAKSFSASTEDPFVMFEQTQGSFKPNNNNGASSVDDYLDSFFPGTRSCTRQSQSSATEDSVYDALFNNNVVPKQQTKAPFQSSHGTKKASSKANNTDDFSYLFGMGDAPPSGEFQEIEGESEERRKARFNHHITTRERMIKALNEKNNRDLQAQREQDEKHRVAAILDGDIRRWAVGKEGNLRALLSSLQHVIWPGSGWQPISLTDLITSTAVKKAYYKATLFVHPDKVQQKGANVQQKYIAEKVFDLLKEAWNKFNAEEFKKQ